MLHGVDELVGQHLRATDGRAGTVDDFLFNQDTWAVTWLVAELGSWLAPHPVLVPRSALLALDPGSLDVDVALDRKAIGSLEPERSELSPPAAHDGVGPAYCAWNGLWMDGAPTSFVLGPPPETRSADAHTRGVRDVIGGEVLAVGGLVGYVTDLLVDDRAWSLRYFVVRMGSFLFGREVLAPVGCIREARWERRSFLVDVPRDVLEEELSYDPTQPLTSDVEARLYERFGRRP